MSGVVFTSLVVFVSEIAVIELAELNRLICGTSTSCALMPYALFMKYFLYVYLILTFPITLDAYKSLLTRRL